MIYGFCFAFACAVGHRFRLYDDADRVGSLWPMKISAVVVILASVGIAGYVGFAANCKTKSECNVVHSYISAIPVSSFFSRRLNFNPIAIHISDFPSPKSTEDH